MVHFAYMPSPLPRQVKWNLFARTIPSTSAFPRLVAGRLLHHYFRGLLGVHSRYGLHARQVAFATLCTRGFSSLVASTTALIATGWSEPVPGRVYPRCGPAPSRRTRERRYRDLRQVVSPRPSLDSRIRLVIYSRNEASRPKSPQSIRTTPGACPPPAASGMLRNSGGAGRTNHAGVPCEERRG